MQQFEPEQKKPSIPTSLPENVRDHNQPARYEKLNEENTQHSLASKQQTVSRLLRSYAGWYPRWWLLAALFSALLLAAGVGLWNSLLCPTDITTNKALICHLTDTTDFLQISLIWLLFLAFWLLSFTFGVKWIELPHPRPRTQHIQKKVQQMTAFQTVQSALVLQGIIACGMLVLLWWQNSLPAIPFALLSICAFISHCSLFYQRTTEKRRLLLILYGLVALLLLIAQIIFKHHFFEHLQEEWLLLCLEGLLIIIGTGAIFWHSPTRETHQRMEIQQLQQQELHNISPLTILASLWPFSHLIPPE